MDASRKYDLEDLSKMLQDDRLSPRAKYEVEETMHKLVNQSVPVTSLRERLVRATRGGDTYEIRKIQQHIQAIRQAETNGREF